MILLMRAAGILFADTVPAHEALSPRPLARPRREDQVHGPEEEAQAQARPPAPELARSAGGGCQAMGSVQPNGGQPTAQHGRGNRGGASERAWRCWALGWMATRRRLLLSSSNGHTLPRTAPDGDKGLRQCDREGSITDALDPSSPIGGVHACMLAEHRARAQ